MSAPRVPVLLVVSARSGAGKTTTLTGLVRALVARGVRVAAVKRTHHAVPEDAPGKDSTRLREAGARTTALAGPDGVVVFSDPVGSGAGERSSGASEALRVRRLAAAVAILAGADLVLVEGGREVPRLPRIEVVPPGGPVSTPWPRTLVAVCADPVRRGVRGRPGSPAGAPPAVPVLRRDDAAGLAEVVLSRFGLRRSGVSASRGPARPSTRGSPRGTGTRGASGASGGGTRGRRR